MKNHLTIYEIQLDAVFEKEVSHLGGSLSPNSLDEKSMSYYKNPIENFSSFLGKIKKAEGMNTIFKRIKYGYICNESLNACAFMNDDNLVLGINSGLVDTIINAANSIFTDGSSVHRIGDSTKEVSEQIINIDHNGNSNSIFVHEHASKGFNSDNIDTNKRLFDLNSNYRINTWPVPFDFLRRNAAQIVIEYAVEFILLHELSHFLCGHLFILDSNILPVHMSDGENSFFIEGLQSNANYLFELDADAMAIQMAIGSGLVMPLPNQKNFFGKHLDENIRYLKHAYNELFPRKDYIYLWIISVNLVLFILAQKKPSIHAWNSGTHPHPLYRMAIFVRAISSFENNDLVKEINNEYIEAMSDLHKFWDSHDIPGVENLFVGAIWNDIFADIEKLLNWGWNSEGDESMLKKAHIQNLRFYGNKVNNLLKV